MSLIRRIALCGLWFCLGFLAGVVAGKDNDRVRILYNGKIFTAELDRPYAEAVAIRGKQIVAVGSLPEVAAAAGPNAERIDLQGKCLLPGFIDGRTATRSTEGLTESPQMPARKFNPSRI